jgi:hypothetical protein
MRCLCLFIHYFNPRGPFGGKSKHQNSELRRQIVERALFSLKTLHHLDVRVCGHGGHSLVPLDLDLENRTTNPQFLVFEALQLLQDFREDYDQFLVVEDDLLVSADVFYNVATFNAQFGKSSIHRWILHPNRIEFQRGSNPFCIDLSVVRRRLGDPIDFDGRQLQEHENPHSGLLLVDRAQLEIIRQEVEPTFRGSVIGGPMASAFAHYHRPFRLFRFIDGLDRHTIQHLDPMDWQQPSLAERAVRRLRRSFQSVSHE